MSCSLEEWNEDNFRQAARRDAGGAAGGPGGGGDRVDGRGDDAGGGESAGDPEFDDTRPEPLIKDCFKTTKTRRHQEINSANHPYFPAFFFVPPCLGG